MADNLGIVVDVELQVSDASIGTIKANINNSTSGMSLNPIKVELEVSNLGEIDKLKASLKDIQKLASGISVASTPNNQQLAADSHAEFKALALEYQAMQGDQSIAHQTILNNIKEQVAARQAAAAIEKADNAARIDAEKKLSEERSKAAQELMDASKRKSALGFDITKEATDVAEMIEKIRALNLEGEKGADIFKGVGDAFRNLAENTDPGKNIENVAKLRVEMDKLGKVIQDAGKTETPAFNEQNAAIQKATASLAKYTSAIYLLRKAYQMFSEMAGTVADLDKNLVNLQMVTMGTREETKGLLSTYSEMARTLGSTTGEVADSADEWLRQGKTVQETNELIKASMVLSKISGMDSATSTKMLTASMKGYGIEVANVYDILDAVSSIDLESATSAEGLMLGMSRVANFADEVGISMEKLLGMLATVGETTQRNMGSIGDSFKTIFSRMSNIKLNKLELIDEGQVEDLSDVERSLSRVGIALRDDTYTFRNFGDVLDEISTRWGTFDDVTKRSIATALGGARRIEDVIALMENYGTALKLTETAFGAGGTAQAKFDEAYMNSIEAHANKLTTALEQLAMATMDSEFMKGLYDMGTFFVDMATNAGGLIPILGTVGGLLIALSATKIANGINGIVGAISNMIGAATGAAGGLAALVSGIGLMVAAVAVLISIANTLGLFKLATTRAREAVENATKEYGDAQNRLSDISSELSRVGSRIDELNSKEHLTIVEQSELERLQAVTKELETQQKIAQDEASEKKLAKIEADVRQQGLSVMGNAGYEDYSKVNMAILTHNNLLKDQQKYTTQLSTGVYDFGATEEFLRKKLAETNAALKDSSQELRSFYLGSQEALSGLEGMADSDILDAFEKEFLDLVRQIRKSDLELLEIIAPEQAVEINLTNLFKMKINDEEILAEYEAEVERNRESILKNMRYEGIKEALWDDLVTGLQGGTPTDGAKNIVKAMLGEEFENPDMEQIGEIFNNVSKALLDEYSQSVDGLWNKIDAETRATFEKSPIELLSAEAFKNRGEWQTDFAELAKELTDIAAAGGDLSEAFKDDKFGLLLQEASKLGIDLPSLIEHFEALGIAQKTLEDSNLPKATSIGFEEATASAKEFIAAQTLISKAQKELADNGYISEDTSAELIDSKHELVQAMLDETGAWQGLGATQKEVFEQNKAQVIENLEMAKGNLEHERQLKIDQRDAYDQTTEAGKEYAEAMQLEIDSTDKLIAKVAQQILLYGLMSDEWAGLMENAPAQSMFADVDKFAGGWSGLATAMEQFKSQGKLSVDQARALIEENATFARYLERTADGYRLNEEAVNALTVAEDRQVKAKQELIDAEIAKADSLLFVSAYTQTLTDLMNTLDEDSRLGSLLSGIVDVNSEFKSGNLTVSEYAGKLQESFANMGGFSERTRELGNEMVSTFNKGSASIDLLNRDMVALEDGTYATLDSFSSKFSGVGDVLFTTIFDGVQHSVDDTLDYVYSQLEAGLSLEDLDVYLGTFPSTKAATEYAMALHGAQEEYYNLIQLQNEFNSLSKEQQEIMVTGFAQALGGGMSSLQSQFANKEITSMEYISGLLAYNKAMLEARKVTEGLSDALEKNGEVDSIAVGMAAAIAEVEGLSDALTFLSDNYKILGKITNEAGLIVADTNKVLTATDYQKLTAGLIKYGNAMRDVGKSMDFDAQLKANNLQAIRFADGSIKGFERINKEIGTTNEALVGMSATTQTAATNGMNTLESATSDALRAMGDAVADFTYTISVDNLITGGSLQGQILAGTPGPTGSLSISGSGGAALGQALHGMASALDNGANIASIFGNSRGSGGSGGSGKSKSAAELAKEEGDDLFAELKHRRALEKIDLAQYTKEYEAITNKYFAGQADLIKDYRGHLETLYDLKKELFEEDIARSEHQIAMLEQSSGTEGQQIAIYQNMQNQILQVMNEYRAMGLAENSEYLMELKEQYWDYVEAIKDLQRSVLEAQKELVEKLKGDSESAVAGVVDVIDAQIKALNDNIDAIGDEIKALQEQKKALQDSNKERDKALKLAELEAALEKAKERTIRIYRKDVGFVYEQDTDAIRKAEEALEKQRQQDAIDAIDAEIEAKKNQQDALKEEIDGWNKYKEMWTSIADDVQKEQDRLKAIQVLGADFEEKILKQRMDILENFADQYKDVLREIISLNDQLDAMDRESLASGVDSGTAAQVGVAPSNARASDISSTLQKGDSGANVKKLQETLLALGYTVGAAGASGTFDAGLEYALRAFQSENGLQQTGTLDAETKARLKLKGYRFGRLGGVATYAHVDEQGQREIVVRQDGSKIKYLEYGDSVIPHQQSNTLLQLATNPVEFLTKALMATPLIQKAQTGASFVIGDIVISNPVGNSEDVAREIRMNLGNAVAQMAARL